MKKVLFVLAFVAVYGVSLAMSSATVVTVDEAQVTIVADVDDNNIVTPEGEKEKEKEKKGTKAKAEVKGDAKAKGCEGAKGEAKACGGEAKKDCGSSCGGEKK